MSLAKIRSYWNRKGLESNMTGVLIRRGDRDFPGGPALKNLPFSAGDLGSIPGQGTKILHASGLTCTGTIDPCTLEPIERSLCTTTKILPAITKTQFSQK